MIASLLLALALGQAPEQAPDAAADTTPKVATSTTLDVALLGPDRPIHVRLKLSVDGKTLNETWRKHLAKWFTFLDRDGNGELSEMELNNAPPPVVLAQGLRQGNVVYSSGLGVPMKAFGQPPAVDVFTEYYLANGAGPLSVAPSQHQADTTSEIIFKKLDTDGDGKLSKDELQNSDKLLRQYDTDDDETVSLAELGGNPFLPGRAAVASPNGMMGIPSQVQQVIVLGRATNLSELLVRYDANKDGKLDKKEVAFDAALFRKLDKNNDRGLDLAEMIVWAAMPPEAEWSANWPALSGINTGSVVPATTKSGALALDDVDVRFSPLPRQNFGNASPASYLLRIYQIADPSGKGVDREALKGPQFQLLAQVFGLLDRDNDGKLDMKEVKDFVDLQAEGLDCHVVLSFSDSGRGLFSTLDADRDGRLSKRELRALWTRLESRDKDGDGAIAPTEIPRQSTLVAGFGIAVQFARNPAVAFNPGMQPTPRAAYPQGVPNWFMRMDTNGDGEVSRREFLGTTEQFREFDADGDGSISPEEVAKKK